MGIYNVWSCGGGVQSAAIASLIVRGRIPKPDLSIMVDTEREKSNVIEYVNELLIPKLASVGVELIIVKKSEYSKVDLYKGENTLPLIPVYTDKGMAPTFCSSEWKARVVHRYLNAWMPADNCRTWLGMSADEMKRVRVSSMRWNQNFYPLLDEEFNLCYDREDCIREVTETAGWPRPPRSSCWMCPNQTSEDWAETTPEDMKRAQQFEIELQARDPNVYLHRSKQPISMVDFSSFKRSDAEYGCFGQCHT